MATPVDHMDHVDQDQSPGLTNLITGIIHDGQELLRQQLHLFQVELKNDLKRTKEATLPLVIGGVVAAMGGFLLLVTLALWLHELWPAALSLAGAFGIVTGVVLVAGGVLIVLGKLRFDKFNPLPDKSVEALKETVQWKTKT